MKALDAETRARLLALAIPEAQHARERLLELLPADRRAAAASLTHEGVARLAADLVCEGAALPAGRSGFVPEEPLRRGTHACLFYKRPEELLILVVRAFTAALERDELCVWATPRWLHPREAARTLVELEPDLEPALEEGRIEVESSDAGYLDEGGRLRPQDEILAAWKAKERRALEQGFTAMLAVGDTSELVRLADLDGYLAYEHAVTPALKGTTISGLCTYSLAGCPSSVIGRLLYPHAHAVLAVGRSWQAVGDADLGREQIRAVLRSGQWITPGPGGAAPPPSCG